MKKKGKFINDSKEVRKKTVEEEIAQSIRDRSWLACLRGDNARITSCHLECGAVVLGCTNIFTQEWLEKQLKELNPFQNKMLSSE